jgi:nucleotide-binding universal stress UspA family protein
MSVFPTKILLATDGSDESDLAATTAAELARSTDSELDVIYVLEVEPWHFPPRELVKYPQRYEDLKE